MRHKMQIRFFLLIAVFLISGFPQTVLAENELPSTLSAPATAVTAPVAKASTPPKNAGEPYLLKMGDRVHISVFGVDDLSGTFQVDRNGVITLPLLDEIAAAGKTKTMLQEEITQRLIGEGYYNDPKVTIEIIALKPFYILGEVRNPGSYDYEPDLDIFKAVAIAGGFTPRAIKDKVIVMRNVDGQKIRIEAGEDTPVLPGDSIKVKQRFF